MPTDSAEDSTGHLARRAVALARREGLAALAVAGVRQVYDRAVRPSLPRRTVLYNGVPVPAARALDTVVPWHTPEPRPNHEAALIAGIRDHVRPGDDVVVVGGGSGASSVVAGRQTGPTGSVTTFEGSADEVALTAATIELSDVSAWTTVTHAVVGRARSLRGASGDATTVAPDGLPDCDVLVLDCEGAEVDILRDGAVSSRVVIVETHGIYDAPPDRVADLLANAGYTVRSREIGGRSEAHCREHGIYVLVAVAEEVP